MDTHAFPEDVKVQRFCLTLIGDVRLWYKSLRPIALYFGMVYRHSLDSNIQRREMPENGYFMFGDHFTLM